MRPRPSLLLATLLTLVAVPAASGSSAAAEPIEPAVLSAAAIDSLVQSGHVQPTTPLPQAPGRSLAEAAECDFGDTVCGVIYNPLYDGIAYGIIHNWGEGYSQILHRGQRSNRFWRDTDGFYVGAGACARLGVWTPDPNGAFYWRDYFYNGPANVKVFNYTFEHHVTAWNRRC